MKHKLTSNLGLKFLSLVVAFLIWLLVTNVDNPTVSQLFKDVKIQVVNEDSVTEIDKVYDIISEETVIIKVTERRSVVRSLTSSDFTVIADMENLTEMNTVPLTVTCSNPAVTWDEIEMSPSSMRVNLEQKKQSDFVVNVAVSGTPENGYEVGKTEIVGGKTVQIAGPESLLNKIGQVVAEITVNGIRTDQRLVANLRVYDKNGDLMTNQMSRLQIKNANGVLLSDNTVMVDVTLWDVMTDIPVEVEVTGTPADGYRVTEVSLVPVTVNLVGTQEALARLDGKLVLKDKISVDGASENITQDFDLTDTLSDYDDIRLVANADPTVSVSVQIEKTGDHTMRIPLSNLEIFNKPENMVLTYSPADELSVSVHRDDESENTIGISDIKASIDLAVCEEAGTYEIPVEIELPEGYTLVSEVTIVVTSAKQEQPVEENDKDTEG